MLLGAVSRAELEDFAPWAEHLRQPYAPDPDAVARLTESLRGIEIVALIGTWCPDSYHQVPRLLRIIDAARFPSGGLTLIGLDRTKRDEAGLAKRWGVTRVPTFILLRDGVEIGRIVERPDAALEAHLARIVAS